MKTTPRALALLALAGLAAASHTAFAQPLDESVKQLIVCVAPEWHSPHVTIRCVEKNAGIWKPAGAPMRGLIGKNGLAWGLGIFPAEQGRTSKSEGDGRSPAGIFAVGRIFGYAKHLPADADFPYHQVTSADAWIDDPAHPLYNRHVVLKGPNPPDSLLRQRMRLGDAAYRWMIEIRHNASPVVPGAGSAIFIHIRRGENRPTAGCTALAEEDIEWLVRWMREDSRPHVVALPREDYRMLWRAWALPDPESAGLFSE